MEYFRYRQFDDDNDEIWHTSPSLRMDVDVDASISDADVIIHDADVHRAASSHRLRHPVLRAEQTGTCM